MALDFPSSPTVGQTYTSGTTVWRWDGSTWAASVSGGAYVYAGDTAPSPAATGSLWWDSTTGTLRVYYTDANSSQWVDAVPGLSSSYGVTVNSGTTVVDFGSTGSTHATVTLTGLTGVLATSVVRARVAPIATADHSADEHIMAATMMDVVAASIVAGDGFTIHAIARPQPNALSFPVRDDRGRASATVGHNTTLQQGAFPSIGGQDIAVLTGQFTIQYDWS